MRFRRTPRTESVSSRLSDAPRSCASSNSVCTSWRAAAMELRKSAGSVAVRAPPWADGLRIRPPALRPVRPSRRRRACIFGALVPLRLPLQLGNSGVRSTSTTRGSNALPAFGRNHLHGLLERQGAPVLAVRGERVQAIDRRQDARAERNLVALAGPPGIRSRPTSRGARARSAPPDRETAPAPGSRRPPPDGSSSSRTPPASAGRVSR